MVVAQHTLQTTWACCLSTLPFFLCAPRPNSWTALGVWGIKQLDKRCKLINVPFILPVSLFQTVLIFHVLILGCMPSVRGLVPRPSAPRTVMYLRAKAMEGA